MYADIISHLNTESSDPNNQSVKKNLATDLLKSNLTFDQAALNDYCIENYDSGNKFEPIF